MKHHPKSNNGRFSKKQKQSSRHMMYARNGSPMRDRGFGVSEETMQKAGILARFFPALMALKSQRKVG